MSVDDDHFMICAPSGSSRCGKVTQVLQRGSGPVRRPVTGLCLLIVDPQVSKLGTSFQVCLSLLYLNNLLPNLIFYISCCAMLFYREQMLIQDLRDGNIEASEYLKKLVSV